MSLILIGRGLVDKYIVFGCYLVKISWKEEVGGIFRYKFRRTRLEVMKISCEYNFGQDLVRNM